MIIKQDVYVGVLEEVYTVESSLSGDTKSLVIAGCQEEAIAIYTAVRLSNFKLVKTSEAVDYMKHTSLVTYTADDGINSTRTITVFASEVPCIGLHK